MVTEVFCLDEAPEISRRELLLFSLLIPVGLVASCSGERVPHSSGGLIKRQDSGYKGGTFKPKK